MGFKTFTCVICGAECTKRNSLVYGEGRACKTHDEVVASEQAKKDSKKKDLLNDLLQSFKTTGSKTSTKEQILKWLEDKIETMRSLVNHVVSANHDLITMKEAKLINLDYTVTDEFVTEFMTLVVAHHDDGDWAIIKKAQKKPVQVQQNRTKKDKNDEREIHYRVKEHRGAKEAPRHKPSPKRKSSPRR